MRTFTIRLTTALSLLFASTTQANTPVYYIEADGVVTFEAESAAVTGDWQLKSSIVGYAGNGYIQWMGADRLATSKAGKDTLTYHFQINTPGNYQMRWRNRIAKGDNATEHNDSWIRFPTGSNIAGQHALSGWTKVFMNRKNAWYWDAHTVDNVGKPLRQFFGRGNHTIEISGRSNGHAIDRIVLYKYDDVNYKDSKFDGLPASNTTSDPVGPAIEPSVPAVVEPAPVTPAPVAPTPVANPDPSPHQQTTATGGTNNPVGGDTEQLPGECHSNRLTLSPLEDVYTQAGEYLETAELRVEYGRRQTLLKFDLSHVPAAIQAELHYTIGSDAGAGRVNLHLGSHTNWPNDNQGANNVPSSMAVLGSAQGQWVSGSRHMISVNANLLMADVLTVVMDMDSGGSDFSLHSSASEDQGPRLILTGAAGFCENFAATTAANATAGNEAPASTTGSSAGETGLPGASANPGSLPSGAANTLNSTGSGQLSFLSLILLCGCALWQRACGYCAAKSGLSVRQIPLT